MTNDEIRDKSGNGAPGGTCTHTLPADNGLLFFSATGAFEMQNAQCKMHPSSILHYAFPILHSALGVAGNAPALGTDLVRLSFIKRTMLFTSHPQIKFQIPNSKLQRSIKSQISISKATRGKASIWNLKFNGSLEFECWSLEFLTWLPELVPPQHLAG